MKLYPISENQYHYGTICVYPQSNSTYDEALLKLYDELIKIISKHEKMFIVHNGNFKSIMFNQNIEELILPIKNIWIRDYAPIWGTIKGALYAINFNYQKAISNGSIEEYIINNEVARILNLKVIALEQEFEGGNYLSDGRYIYLCKNPISKDKRYREWIEQQFYHIFDIEKIIWVNNRFELDVCHHLDNVCCLSNDDKLVHFRQPRSNDFMANVYCFNGRIILSARYKENNKYLKLINEYFPGKSHYFLDISPLTRLHGGLHCILKEIPQV